MVQDGLLVFRMPTSVSGSCRTGREVHVVQDRTGLPLFWRILPEQECGIEAPSLSGTLAELKTYGLNEERLILSGGRRSGLSADILLDAGVSFLTRVHGDEAAFPEILAAYGSEIQLPDHPVLYRGRQYHVLRTGWAAGRDRSVYAYLCLDAGVMAEEIPDWIRGACDPDRGGFSGFHDAEETECFLLLSTEKIPEEDVLTLWSAQEQAGELSAICRRHSDLPMQNGYGDDVFRGHLMVSFLAAVIRKRMADVMAGAGDTLDHAFWLLNSLQAVVISDHLIVNKQNEAMKEIFRLFHVAVPDRLEIPL